MTEYEPNDDWKARHFLFKGSPLGFICHNCGTLIVNCFFCGGLLCECKDRKTCYLDGMFIHCDERLCGSSDGHHVDNVERAGSTPAGGTTVGGR